MDEATEQTPRHRRGFALLTPERRREIARMGGAAIPSTSRTFSRDREKAVAAGRAGGLRTPPTARSFSTNRVLAAEAGRKGGQEAQRRRARPAQSGPGEQQHD